jgi:hypothetical protein
MTGAVVLGGIDEALVGVIGGGGGVGEALKLMVLLSDLPTPDLDNTVGAPFDCLLLISLNRCEESSVIVIIRLSADVGVLSDGSPMDPLFLLSLGEGRLF